MHLATLQAVVAEDLGIVRVLQDSLVGPWETATAWGLECIPVTQVSEVLLGILAAEG